MDSHTHTIALAGKSTEINSVCKSNNERPTTFDAFQPTNLKLFKTLKAFYH